MPLFDYQCLDCGKIVEILVSNKKDEPVCSACGSTRMKKLLSAHSSLSGPLKNNKPGFGDTACCGSKPGQVNGCAGPGSCCGKNF
jgi:putative FmdB family regulatory protein